MQEKQSDNESDKVVQSEDEEEGGNVKDKVENEEEADPQEQELRKALSETAQQPQ